MTSIISFEGVTKRFGTTTVLEGFDFTVARGEKVAIIGPSGSGKSTILRTIMGLEDVDGGRVFIDGEVLWDPKEGLNKRNASRKHLHHMRAKVGMVFQSFNLFPNLTAAENVAAGPRHVLGLSKQQAAEKALKLLDQVGLSDQANKYPSTLSGGQQQRVAIARAMALEPQIMLFDEATSALDPEKVGEVLDVMRSLSRERDLTIVVVTHQIGVARALADRICFMEGGRILEQAAPAALLEHPQNQRTAAFLRAVHLS